MSDITPAGWQPDPTGRHEHRYWDGTTWTDNVSDAGTAATDPFTVAAAPEAATPEAIGASDAPTWGDPTTSTPVPPADTTAAWSTTPGAPVPPLPQAVAAGSDGSGGSKRGLLIGGGILAAIAVAVVAFLALGGDDDTVSTDDLKARMVALLTDDEQIGLSQTDAECAADVVVNEIGADRLQEVDFTADDPPPGLEDEFNAALVQAVQDCNIDITGGSTDTGDTTTTEDSGGDTTTTTEEATSDDGGTTDFGTSIPDNFEDILADTYENTLGLPRDKAECLAGKLADAIESGELSEDQAASAVFEYLEACDISLNEIGAN